MQNPPVLLLTFNRPDLAVATARALTRTVPSEIYLASDGPRTEAERAIVNETRDAVVEEIGGAVPVRTRFLDTNLGCRHGVASAISWFFDHVDAGIIIEDDCLPTRSFIEFSRQMLDRYANDERVMHVSGYYGGPASEPGRYVYSKLPRVWGWASWSRAWKLNLATQPSESELRRAYGSRSMAKFRSQRQEAVLQQRVDTWDCEWGTTVALNGLAIQPLVNLVTNIGFGDARATHTTRPNDSVSQNIASEHENPIWVGPPAQLPDRDLDLTVFRRDVAPPLVRTVMWLPSPLRRAVGSVADRRRAPVAQQPQPEQRR